MHLKKFRLAGTVAACALALAACGGDDGEDTTPTAPPSTSVTAVASPTSAAWATAAPPTATPEPPPAADAAAIDALVRSSIAAYNASNWTAVVAMYSACLVQRLPQGDELTADLQQARSQSGAAAVISIVGIEVRGDRATAQVAVDQERTDPRISTSTYYFEREGGVWKLSAGFCENAPAPAPGG